MGIIYPPIPMLGGVNLFTDPAALPENQVVATKNLAPVNHQRISKRLGPMYLGGISASNDYPLAGVISPFVPSIVPWDVVVITRPASGNEVLTVQALIDGNPTGEALDTGFFYTRRPWMFTTGNTVYILPGSDAIPIAPATVPSFWKMTYDSTGRLVTYDNFSGTGNDGVRPKVASPYKRRIVYANFGPGYENTILFSDNNAPYTVGNSVLAANGRAINLTIAQDGDEIVALVEVMLFRESTPASSALLVLRRFGSPFVITGEPDQTTGGTSTIDIKRDSANAGCANPYTVARTPYGIIWAGQDDVWCFDYGTVRNIGLAISPALKDNPPDQQIWWSGAFFNGFYRLAVWGKGQDYAFPNAPSDQWWLHLDGGLPKSWREAEWFGPQQILNGATNAVSASAATRVMLAENRAGHENKLYGVEVGVVADAATRAITLISYDQNKGRDLASNPDVLPVYQTSGCEIEGLVVSREMDVEPNYEKSSDGIQGTIRPDNEVQLNLAIISDGGVDKQEVSKGISATGFRGNISELDTDRIGRGKPVGFSIYATPGQRPIANTFQFELGDDAGYPIIKDINDTLIVHFNEDPFTEPPRLAWLATIDPGIYTRDELFTALQTAINAGKLGHSSNWTLSINSSGQIEFTASSTLHLDCRIVIVYNTAETGVTVTPELAANCRRLGGMLGLIPNATQNAGVVGTIGQPSVITGTDPLYPNGISHYELWGLKANIEVFPRDP